VEKKTVRLGKLHEGESEKILGSNKQPKNLRKKTKPITRRNSDQKMKSAGKGEKRGFAKDGEKIGGSC